MADPTSIVGLAAGLVSLGIQVSGGITAYLDAVKCRADDITSANRQATNFENVLRIIQTALARVDPSHQVSTTVVDECLKSCESEVKGLKDFVSGLVGSDISQPKFMDKIKEKTRKLTYVFDRPKLEQLEGRLSRVNGIFQTALQALELDISSSANETLGTIESTSSTISSDLLVVRSEVAVLSGPLVEVKDSLPNIKHSIDSLPPLIALKTDSLSTEIRDGTQTIRGDLQQLQSYFRSSSESDRVQSNQIEQLVQNSEQSHRSIANIERMLSERGPHGAPRDPQEQRMDSNILVGRLVAKPSNLRALCDGVASLPEQGEASLERSSTRVESLSMYSVVKGGRHDCICRRRKRYQRQQLRWGPIELYDEASFAEEHYPNCKSSQIVTASHRHRSVGLKYTGITGLLNRAIAMAFSMSSGAGGFSISPSFTYYATVDEDSAPAFCLFRTFQNACYYCHRDDLNGLLELVSRKILSLFQERQASPTDMSSYNKTLLHVAGDATSRTLMRRPRLDLSKFVNLFKMLLRCGVPITNDYYGRSPFQEVLIRVNGTQAKVAEAFFPEEYEASQLVSTDFLISAPHWRLKQLFVLKESQRIAKAFDCGPLSLAIVANDLDKTRKILTYHPTTIEERDLCGRTPLHFAADKPECLQLLLQVTNDELLNRLDNSGYAPADYALDLSHTICRVQKSMLCDAQCPCTTCLELLFNANCALYYPTDILYHTLRATSRRGMVKHANEMKNRRETLKCLAREHLSILEIEEFRLEDENILDAHASRVIKRLQEHNVDVPAFLAVSRGGRFVTENLRYGSIYHCVHDDVEADYFFNIGFRDMNAPNAYGFPPLATPYSFADRQPSYILWLVEHGAQLFHRLEYTHPTKQENTIIGATSAHWVFSHIGEYLKMVCNGYVTPDSNEKRAIGQLNVQVLPVDVVDECCCKCSLSGCSPLVWMLKSMLQDTDSDLLDIAQRMYWYMYHFSSDIRMKDYSDAVRFVTSDALNIQHTCCDGGKPFSRRVPKYDLEDIREIEEDQAALLETLEVLVHEFEDKITGILEQQGDVSTSLAEFWTGYWYDRMNEVLKELDGHGISLEERTEAERIGVKWDDDASEISSEGEYETMFDIKYWYRRIEEIA